jgi:hypothetical protein
MAARAEDVSFVDEAERELFAVAILGEDVRKFLLTDPVGRYLHHRAKLMVQQAEVDALKVDPDGWRGWFQARRKLRLIRQRADVARAFMDWLAEAIMEGNNAEQKLEDYRRN